MTKRSPAADAPYTPTEEEVEAHPEWYSDTSAKSSDPTAAATDTPPEPESTPPRG